MDMGLAYKEAIALNEQDDLFAYRSKFFGGDEKLIYLDGNSLGRLPVESKAIIERSVKIEWGERLIRSWNEDWFTKNIELGDKIARIAGASEGEVVITDSTSVNLYKLAHAALRCKKDRTRIVTDELNFPSDIYIFQGLLKEFGEGYELIVVPSRDGMTIDTSDLKETINDNTALVSLSHVAFKSAFRYNMKEITSLGHEKGAMILWDLSHSIGVVPGELNESNADLAVGCTYKYLNGGPGSPAFLYVRKDLQDKLSSPIWGWFGEKNPFDFELKYRPGEGIKRFLAGTPPILSMKAIEPTLDMLNEIGMDRIRRKSVLQSELLLMLASEFLYPLGFQSGSPIDPEKRGSHVSLRHPEACRICKALIDPEIGDTVVIPDFREPDNIRLGITPLYTTCTELFMAVREIRNIVENRLFLKYSPGKDMVT
ncbi:MAG: kynureninase [Bacteroidales bacterium]|nr:kynureninase [Bacteroidales bacterium]MDT8373570.1 kynureninase [Bacteroidales bacterium]